MALQKELAAQNNGIRTAFPAAYWRIEEVSFATEGGQFFVRFALHAYADKDAAALVAQTPSSLEMGSPAGVSAVLYCWQSVTPWTEVSEDPVPLTLEEQKALLYPYVKQYLTYLADAIDVLEE